MDPDFRRLAALRRFMVRGDQRALPDFGRQKLRDWIARHAGPLPDTVTIAPLEDMEGRYFQPAEPTDRLLVYIHGGGLVYHDTQSFAPFLAGLADQAGCAVAALDYPKAPETDPLTIRAALARDVALLRRQYAGRRIALAGDSVGGLLALLFAEGWSGAPLAALHLIYPVADLVLEDGAPYGTGHFLDAEMMAWFYSFIRPLVADRPAALPEFNLPLPPVTIHIAECDILAAGAGRLADGLRRGGQQVTEVLHRDLPHDFCLFQGASPAAREAVARIAQLVAEGFG